jgi:coenzyme PQQ precursor peptide PqqA
MRQFAVSALRFQACAVPEAALGFAPRDVALNTLGRPRMAWKAPKIVEVPVGMEINMYACALRK